MKSSTIFIVVVYITAVPNVLLMSSKFKLCSIKDYIHSSLSVSVSILGLTE